MEVVKMKKYKKFLSILLAAAMTFSMAAMPVFAGDDETKTETAGGTEGGSGENAGGSGESAGGSGGTGLAAPQDTSTSSGVISPAAGQSTITTLPFQKVLETDGAVVIPTAEFTFHMVPKEQADKATKNNVGYFTGTPLTTPTTTLTVSNADQSKVTTVVNTTTTEEGKTYVAGYSKTGVKGIVLNGSFTLPQGKTAFPTAGIYSYTVYETQTTGKDENGEDDGSQDQSLTIAADSTQFTVDLYVNNDGNVYYAQSQVFAPNGTEKQPIVFENTLKTASLIINKQVSGTQAVDDTTEYSFWIKIPEGGDSIDLPKGLEIKTTKKSPTKADDTSTVITVYGNPETELDPDKLKENWDDDITDGWCNFTLKANESLEIVGLPAGMIYYLYEEDYSNAGYTTYRQVLSAGSANINLDTPGADSFLKDSTGAKDLEVNLSTGGKGTLSQYQNGVYFLNMINLPANTGITVDVLPYVVVVLAVAAAFAVLLISRKRRNAR
jgi:hypothetical protein